MSNKPKHIERIYSYTPNKAERCHKSFVDEAKKQGVKNPGSKSMRTLKRIIPAKLSNKVRNMLRGIF